MSQRLNRRLAASRAVLLWERLWPLLVPLLGIVGIFVSLALFDILPSLPAWLHSLVLALFATAFLIALYCLVFRLKVPHRDEAARRLELASPFGSRPLQALGDQLANRDSGPVAEALWRAHQERMRTLAESLRLAPPSSSMAERDPWGLRAGVILLLVIAVSGGLHHAQDRVLRALQPAIALPRLGPDSFEVWVTPPAATGLSPILLKPDGAPLSLPVGSTVLGLLTGGWGTADLGINDETLPFTRQDNGSQRVEASLQASGSLSLRQTGQTVASWPVTVIKDAPPAIAFAQRPERDQRQRMLLSVVASDDYGLAHLRVRFHRASGDPLVVELPLARTHPRSAEVSVWRDLTAHPWAGLTVSASPEAEDQAGQTFVGEAITFSLPERPFTHPTARALVEQRRLLTENPGHAPHTGAVLGRLSLDAPTLLNDDLTVFLALQSARQTLRHPRFNLGEVQDLLWNSALRLEEGSLSSARRNFDEARRALEQALADNAPPEVLERLMGDLRQAMDRMIESLHSQGNRSTPPSDNARLITSEDLHGMIDEMRDLAQTGARDAARKMLDELAQRMENLQSTPSTTPSGEDPGQNALRDMIEQQQRLLEQSHRTAEGLEADQGKNQRSRSAREQGALRESLEALKQSLSSPLKGLEEAARAMGKAQGHLSRGTWEEAVEAQGEALLSLRQAARALAQRNQGRGRPHDPLGRSSNPLRSQDDGSTQIPDHAEIQNSRKILDEIRRRAGEWKRPDSERDYLQRLLRPF